MSRHEHVASSSFCNMTYSQAEKNTGWKTSHTIEECEILIQYILYVYIFLSWHLPKLSFDTLTHVSSAMMPNFTVNFASFHDAPVCKQQLHPTKTYFFKIFFSVVQLRNLGHCEKECQTRSSAVSSSKLYTYLLSCQVDIRRLCQRVLFSVKHVFWEGTPQLFFKSIPVNNRDLSSFKNHDLIDWWLWAFPRCERFGSSESSAYWLGPSSSWVSESSSRVRKKLRRIPSYWGRLPFFQYLSWY